MDWLPEHLKGAADRYGRAMGEGGLIKDGLAAVMSYAVELVAARGVGAIELSEGFEDILSNMEMRGTKREAQAALTVRGLLAARASLGATVATLQAKVAEVERQNRRLSALTLHDAEGRVMTQGALNALFSQYNAAGDVLGEVIGLRNVSPAQGEAHPCHLATPHPARCGRRCRSATTPRAEVERLKAETKELRVENAMRKRRDVAVEAALKEAGISGVALDMGVHRLKERVRALDQDSADAMENWRLAQKREQEERAARKTAESRLAAIRAAIETMGYEPRWSDDRARAVLVELWGRVEGDAPQEGKAGHVRGCPLSPDEPVPAPSGTACECDRIRRDVARLAAPVGRYPCSDTCTHDDAASPGHPDRVKERSEAGEEVGRRPNDADTFVTIENGVEGTLYYTRTQIERYAEKKAEAMRAACIEAIQDEKDEIGLTDYQRDRLKAAIEGAAP